MPKQLFLEGFHLVPIVKAIDLDAVTVEPHALNPVQIGPTEGATWFTDVWPENWANLQRDYNESEKSREAALANDKVTAKRAARKTKKATP